MQVTTLKLEQIDITGGTQPRAEINTDTVRDYADDMINGDKFQPVDVYFDGVVYWLADGFHRFHAARKAELSEIEATVYQGTLREAILHSVGANAKHGLRRSNEDKRRSVKTLLEDEEWSQRSNRWIAEICGVSDRFVGNLRNDSGANGSHLNQTRTGKDGKEYPASNPETTDSRDADDDDDTRFIVPDEEEDEEEDAEYFDPFEEAMPGTAGVEFEVSEEVLNPDSPTVEEVLGDDKEEEVQEEETKEERRLTDQEWLFTLPLYWKIVDEGLDPTPFTESAITYRKAEKAIRQIKTCVTQNLSKYNETHFAEKIRAVGMIRHPKHWKFVRGVQGNFQV